MRKLQDFNIEIVRLPTSDLDKLIWHKSATKSADQRSNNDNGDNDD